jgi:hypothetical protein
MVYGLCARVYGLGLRVRRTAEADEEHAEAEEPPKAASEEESEKAAEAARKEDIDRGGGRPPPAGGRGRKMRTHPNLDKVSKHGQTMKPKTRS